MSLPLLVLGTALLAACGGTTTVEPAVAPAEPAPESVPAPEESAPAESATTSDEQEADPRSRDEQEPVRPEDTTRPLAPSLAGTSYDGESVSLEDFKGKPVFVKFYSAH